MPISPPVGANLFAQRCQNMPISCE